MCRTTDDILFFSIMKPPYLRSEDLICCCDVFGSHEDFSVAVNIYAGFDVDFNLVIMCGSSDTDNSGGYNSTYAVVDKDEALRLARHLGISLRELPAEIGRSMEEWCEISAPTPTDVRNCFKDITECLVDEGCHFTILTTPS